MPGRAETLYQDLKDRDAIEALIGEPEDGHLDCKEWPAKEKDGHEMFAKAVCGLANSDGGVLVIGMRAASQRPGGPDVISDLAPVANTSYLRSRLLTLAGQLVEPPIVGIDSREIPEAHGSTSGVVIVFVPRSEGPPHRSRKDSKFYIRVGSSTLPMEYWQIEERFGRRPHPKLELILQEREKLNNGTRFLILGLRNSGRGIARFPGLLFKKLPGYFLDPFGIDGNQNFGLPQRPSESDSIIFGGGVDDVIYPGQSLMIGKLKQEGKMIHGHQRKTRFVFEQAHFICEIACEGCQTSTVDLVFPPGELILDY